MLLSVSRIEVRIHVLFIVVAKSHHNYIQMQMLAVLYRKKRDLLNSHILHLTFSLVGTVDSGRESTVIPNRAAFEDLLCDIEVSIRPSNFPILPETTLIFYTIPKLN